MPVDASEHGPVSGPSQRERALADARPVRWMGSLLRLCTVALQRQAQSESELPRRAEPLFDVHARPAWPSSKSSCWSASRFRCGIAGRTCRRRRRIRWKCALWRSSSRGTFSIPVRTVFSASATSNSSPHRIRSGSISTIRTRRTTSSRSMTCTSRSTGRCIIHVSSKDVIHSFKLPVMRVETDAIPGMEIAIHFTPVMTNESGRERQVGDRLRAALRPRALPHARADVRSLERDVQEVAGGARRRRRPASARRQ